MLALGSWKQLCDVSFSIQVTFERYKWLRNKLLPCLNYDLDFGWLVGWLVVVLMSHSAIFQLYSDGTVVQFPNFDLLPGTQRHGQLGVFSVRAYPDTGTGTSKDVFYLLSIRGPTRGEVRVYWESNPDRSIHSPARYLYATAAGTLTLAIST